MNQPVRRGNTYRERLALYARALSTTQYPAVHGDLDGNCELGLRVFVKSNQKKRLEQLRVELAFLSAVFDDLDAILNAYILDRTLTPYGSISDDGERCLRWLGTARELSPEQMDYVACLLARYAVEAAGRANRSGYLRFLELWSLADQLSRTLDTNPGLLIHLNPIRVWSRFESKALLDGQDTPPAEVLYFAVQDDVRTAVLDAAGRALVQELSSYGPCTLDDWAGLTEHADRVGLVELCRDMSEMGLMAFG